jgi:hypothetical protein
MIRRVRISLGLAVAIATAPLVAGAQDSVVVSPFLFATVPVWSRTVTSVDAGYNARTFEPVAGERLEPRATALVAFSPSFAIQGQIGGASTLDHRAAMSGQVEALVSPFRSGAFSLGGSLGMRHEYAGANVALARLVGARLTGETGLAADVLVEHAFAAGRDPVDVVATVAATHALGSKAWLGVEAVGSDLEGFVDSDEAEGGATILVGPTLAVAVTDHWRIVFGGGPVLRATTNSRAAFATEPGLPIAPQRSGYVVRTSLRRSW